MKFQKKKNTEEYVKILGIQGSLPRYEILGP